MNYLNPASKRARILATFGLLAALAVWRTVVVFDRRVTERRDALAAVQQYRESERISALAERADSRESARLEGLAAESERAAAASERRGVVSLLRSDTTVYITLTFLLGGVLAVGFSFLRAARTRSMRGIGATAEPPDAMGEGEMRNAIPARNAQGAAAPISVRRDSTRFNELS